MEMQLRAEEGAPWVVGCLAQPSSWGNLQARQQSVMGLSLSTMFANTAQVPVCHQLSQAASPAPRFPRWSSLQCFSLTSWVPSMGYVTSCRNQHHSPQMPPDFTLAPALPQADSSRQLASLLHRRTVASPVFLLKPQPLCEFARPCLSPSQPLFALPLPWPPLSPTALPGILPPQALVMLSPRPGTFI